MGQGLLASPDPGQGEKRALALLGSPSQVRRSRPTALTLAGLTHPVLLVTPRDAPAHCAQGDTVCAHGRTGLALGVVVGLLGLGPPSIAWGDVLSDTPSIWVGSQAGPA